MTDTNNPGEKTLTVAPSKLSLRPRSEQGIVRQSFSHGRSKAVVVETVKRRIPGAPGASPAGAAGQGAAGQGSAGHVSAGPAAPPSAGAAPAPAPSAPAPRPEIRLDAPRPGPISSARPQPIVSPKPAPVAPAPVAPAAPPPAPAPAAAAPVPPTAAAPAARAPVRGSAPGASASARPAPRGDGRSDARPGPRMVAPPPATPASPPPRRASSGIVLSSLSESERDARTSALQEARRREVAERERAEQEAKLRAERDARDAKDRAASEARKAEEDQRRRLAEEAKRRGEEAARSRFGEEPPRSAGPAPARPVAGMGGVRPAQIVIARPPRPEPAARPGATARPGAAPADAAAAARGAPVRRPAAAADDEAPKSRRPGLGARPSAAPKSPRPGADRMRGRLTVSTATAGDEERMRSLAASRRRAQRMNRSSGGEAREKITREVTIPETITIQELANRMSERAVDVIRLLMKQGQMLKINDVIDADTAQIIAEDMGHTVRRVAESDVEEGLFDVVDADEGDLSPRPPVVTIMGHVDHGKTSLLDAIRKANVVSGEAGGITQHIGAYQVTAPSGSKISFIDTPGHAAFTAMRARGAKVTDIVVLVVAADDGVMPQTVEAISHAKAAGVPMIVAINKIDKPDAKPERVRTELLQHEVQVESMGGDVQEVEVSALKQTNLDGLLDAIALQAELLDLRANAERPAEGTVIEAKLDRGRGPVATVLVQRGTLKVGDIVVAGSEWGRVRSLIADGGAVVKEAGPSVPVEVLGFNGTPDAGDRVAVVENEARAREVTDYRARQKRENAAARMVGARGSLADMMRDMKSTGRKEFALVVKADVQGSLEAIVGALEKLGTEEVTARVLHSGVGGITESDVILAQASGAAVIGFNVRAHKEAREAAERTGTEIRYYNIIYNLVDDVKAAMSGLLAPTLRETMLGNARILQIFDVSKIGKVAGCVVTDGVVQRGAGVRLIRDNVVIHEGKLSTLQRLKDAVQEVRAGTECGMAFENYQDMRAGDVIECYRVEEVQRTL